MSKLYTNLAMITAIKDLVMSSPVPVVFDHFGGAQAELACSSRASPDLVELVKSGKAYVKIRVPIVPQLAPDFQDCVPFATGAESAAMPNASYGAPNGRIRIHQFDQIGEARLLHAKLGLRAAKMIEHNGHRRGHHEVLDRGDHREVGVELDMPVARFHAFDGRRKARGGDVGIR